jgi:hypothetical protein
LANHSTKLRTKDFFEEIYKMKSTNLQQLGLLLVLTAMISLAPSCGMRAEKQNEDSFVDSSLVVTKNNVRSNIRTNFNSYAGATSNIISFIKVILETLDGSSLRINNEYTVIIENGELQATMDKLKETHMGDLVIRNNEFSLIKEFEFKNASQVEKTFTIKVEGTVDGENVSSYDAFMIEGSDEFLIATKTDKGESFNFENLLKFAFQVNGKDINLEDMNIKFSFSILDETISISKLNENQNQPISLFGSSTVAIIDKLNLTFNKDGLVIPEAGSVQMVITKDNDSSDRLVLNDTGVRLEFSNNDDLDADTEYDVRINRNWEDF